MARTVRPVGLAASAWTRVLTGLAMSGSMKCRLVTGGTMAWKLEGYDTFDGEYYPIGTLSVIEGRSTVDGAKPSYDTYAEALKDARWQLAQLEKTQPSASSGGQGFSGIQDRVYIVHPDGRRERVL